MGDVPGFVPAGKDARIGRPGNPSCRLRSEGRRYGKDLLSYLASACSGRRPHRHDVEFAGALPPRLPSRARARPQSPATRYSARHAVSLYGH